MQELKRMLTAVTASALILSSFAFSAAAEEKPTFPVNENFDGYPAMTESEYVTAAGVDLAGNWQTTAIAEWGYDNQAKAGIVANPSGDGNVLMLEARAAYDGQAVKPAVTYKNLVFTSGDKYNYKYDFYRTTSNAGGGIRFNFKDGNYYALDFVGEWDHSYEYGSETTYSTALLKNGVRVKTVNEDASGVSIVNPENDAVSGYNLYSLGVNVWYSVDITVQKGNINWTVTDKSGNKVVQTGSYSDPEPLFYQPASVQLFAGGQGNEFMYFDNIEISETKAEQENPGDSEGALLYDNFEAYSPKTDASEYVITPDTAIDGSWVTKTILHWGYDNGAKAAVVLNPDGFGNALMLEGRSAYNYPTWFPSAEPSATVFNKDDYYTYSFDYYASVNDTQTGGGIRFNVDGENFYELYFMGTNNYGDGKNTRLSKSTGSTYSLLNAEITSNGLANDSLKPGTWYSVELNYHQGDIKWSVRETSSGAEVQTGSYKDNRAFRADSYTMRLFAGGQGGQYIYFDNVKVTQKANDGPSLDELPVLRDDVSYIADNGDGTKTYSDSFNGYDYLNACVDESDPVSGRKYDNAVGRNDYAKWSLSEVHSNMGYPLAYVDTLSSKMMISGAGSPYYEVYHPAVVNLEFNESNETPRAIKSISANVTKTEHNRFGIRVAVSEDEQSYYEFGRGAAYDWAEKEDGTVLNCYPDFPRNYETGKRATGIYNYAPYVVKCIDGVREIVYFEEDENAASSGSWLWSADWDVTVDDSGLITATLNGTYTLKIRDNDGLLKSYKYPLAVWSAMGATVDDVSITYESEAPIFEDKGSGTAYVTVIPEKYNRANLNSAAAFYDADGTMISVSERQISGVETYSVDTPAAYAYAKVMLYDDDGALVKAYCTKEESIKEPKKEKTVVSIIGDSLTGGDSVPTSKTWPTKLGALLGEDYIVKNYGVPGSVVRDGTEPVDTDGDGRYNNNASWILTKEHDDFLKSEPDIVLIMMGTNDMGMGEVEYENFITTYNKYIEESYAIGAKEIILSYIPIRLLNNGTVNRLNVEQINPLVKQIAESNNLRYIDNYGAVQDYSLLYDGTHFFDAASIEFAKNFYNAVVRTVTADISEDMQTAYVRSASSVNTDIAVAVYKGDTLSGVKLVSGCSIAPEDISNPESTKYSIDVSELGIENGDKIKVMLLDTNTLKPYTAASVIAGKNAYTKGGRAVISGNAKSGETVGVKVYSGADIVFADTAKADGNGYYEFNHALESGTYTVKASDGSSEILVVE